MNDGKRYEDMIDHRSYILKPQKNSGLNGIRTHDDLCDTVTVLYQLSYLADWDLAL